VRTMFATKLEQYGEKLKREAREEGREEGLERGREEGREQGREEGRENGREEESVRVARRLLARGESVADVASVTELSEKRVREIEQEENA
jgi:predicted transposase/invertase (TIGR01784 family)